MNLAASLAPTCCLWIGILIYPSLAPSCLEIGLHSLGIKGMIFFLQLFPPPVFPWEDETLPAEEKRVDHTGLQRPSVYFLKDQHISTWGCIVVSSLFFKSFYMEVPFIGEGGVSQRFAYVLFVMKSRHGKSASLSGQPATRGAASFSLLWLRFCSKFALPSCFPP